MPQLMAIWDGQWEEAMAELNAVLAALEEDDDVEGITHELLNESCPCTNY